MDVEVVGKTVRYCVEKNKDIPDLTLDEFKQFHNDIEADIFNFVTLEESVNARKATGGTAREAVEKEIKLARKALEG
jgi:argininosuccinate lyase